MSEQKPSFRLTPQVYAELEAKVQKTMVVTAQTTEAQAGFMLGIQFVLAALRTGYVVGA